MRRGRKNTVGYTQFRRHWEVKGSSCVIPRRLHTFLARTQRHIYRPRSPGKHSQMSYVVHDGVRDVHAADACTEIGKGLVWAHGEDHRRSNHNLTRAGSKRLTDFAFTRQRKSLTPAFSIAAIRQLTSIFYDSAYKVRPPSYGSWHLSDTNVNSLQRRKELGMSSSNRAAGMALSSMSKTGAFCGVVFRLP